ncbi:MAG: ChbG/HpnK family deacetylase [Lachnospiraceae bacterium]|jgi:predicted glycoside hydrolase/deacetylase ChbG (UPF0249 family)|nr:ChbG/HpnK family deacetylase [Lachnospiraceae bacterium]
MKLLVQADDFGFTKGTTYGTVEGIDHGILTCSGLFTNMPTSEFAAGFIRERPDFCFGLDFNITNGPCVSNPRNVSHLVDETSEFIRSGNRIHDPRFASEEGRREMFPYDEVYCELEAQYEKFIELTGRRPKYIQSHSLSHENYVAAIRNFTEEKKLPYAMDVLERYGFEFYVDYHDNEATMKKIFDPVAQINRSPLKMLLERRESLVKCDYVFIGGHAGYVDAELMKWSTCSIERCKDLELVLSGEVRKWIEEEEIELISYDDLER